MNSTKLLSPWTSETSKRYKRKTIKVYLHRSKRIFPNFDVEIPLIKKNVINYEDSSRVTFHQQRN